MIKISNLSKTFETKDGKVDALKDISITIGDGDIYGIIGMSGAGKSTLVRCINQIEKQTSGSITVGETKMETLSEKELRQMRRKITMIFQGFNLLMQRTCLQNICFPMELAGMKKKDCIKRAKELLEIVGLPDKANVYPSQLSGGQQQRIAIARALATEPEVLLCDEATSALDPKTTVQILELIKDINKKLGITVVVITHQMSVVKKICNKVAIIDKGQVVEEGSVSEVFANPKSEAARHLVFPDSHSEDIEFKPGKKYFTLTFNEADAVNKPIIALLATEKNVTASIMAASTQSVGDKAYGKMLLCIDDEGDNVERALEFLNGFYGVSAVLEVNE